MDCKRAEKLIQPYVKGKIAEKDLGPFITHVRGCPACYEDLETYFIIHRAMDYFEDEKQTSYNLTGLLEADLREREKRARRKRKRFIFLQTLFWTLLLFGAIAALLYFDIIEIPFLKGLV